MPRWIIEMLPNPAICYPKAKSHAQAVARAQDQNILVTYIGPRDNPNRNYETSNFIMHPDGSMDHSVDPTWYTNHKGTP